MKPNRVTPVRSSRLSANHSATWRECVPRCTVHHSPPKNTAPSATPVANATAAGNATAAVNAIPVASAGVVVDSSVITGAIPVRHVLLSTRHPVPGIPAAQGKACDQQRQRPGVDARMTPIDPVAERRAH